ncbi:MAG: type II toxin-antitoxin system HipA family toxin [Candidatus Omnitrophica bacterium]|nr:type II toxin-antitoxin system HipA family toxin [Candidatus Omnitrophota bacterium]
MANDQKSALGATVLLWGEPVGSVFWNNQTNAAEFEYDATFIKKGFQVAPIKMPLSNEIYSFPAHLNQSLNALPGLLADSLPDRFGHALMDAWLRMQGRPAGSLNPVEQLCYVGTRGMGALEYRPAINTGTLDSIPLAIAELTGIAASVLDKKNELSVNVLNNPADALLSLIQIGSSAGGNRAKAIIALNPSTGEVRSGQTAVPDGFEHWILKFDGANERSLGDPVGVGRIEYAYHLMALEAGIKMMPCRLLEESGRAHFMTKRFDRLSGNAKLHVQSLCALQHYDHSLVQVYSYEQVFSTIQQLRLGNESSQEMYRRMVFNILARNQDDHTKNIAFVMNKAGEWQLSPAFDMVWQYSPQGRYTSVHQLSANGKRNNFSIADLEKVADSWGIYKAKEIRHQVSESVASWPRFAKKAGVESQTIESLGKTYRLSLFKRTAVSN